MPTRILLAESDDVLRASLAEQLEQEGYDVVPAADAQAAFIAVRETLSFAIIGLGEGEQLAAQPDLASQLTNFVETRPGFTLAC